MALLHLQFMLVGHCEGFIAFESPWPSLHWIYLGCNCECEVKINLVSNIDPWPYCNLFPINFKVWFGLLFFHKFSVQYSTYSIRECSEARNKYLNYLKPIITPNTYTKLIFLNISCILDKEVFLPVNCYKITNVRITICLRKLSTIQPCYVSVKWRTQVDRD